jgi:hypothetical protein
MSGTVAAGLSRRIIVELRTTRRMPQRKPATPLSLPSSSSSLRNVPGGKVLPADLAVFQARVPDRPLEVGGLEVDHLVPLRLEPPTQGRERMKVPWRSDAQDADSTLESFRSSGRLRTRTTLGTYPHHQRATGRLLPPANHRLLFIARRMSSFIG